MKQIDRDIFDWGEIERDCAQLADECCAYGGLMYRFWKWLERKARANRMALREERDNGN